MDKFDRIINELKPVTDKYPWIMPAILGELDIGEIYRDCLKERYSKLEGCLHPSCKCIRECKYYMNEDT